MITGDENDNKTNERKIISALMSRRSDNAQFVNPQNHFLSEDRVLWHYVMAFGGQATSPYEQKTQQSPSKGFMVSPHPAQGWKKIHWSLGISTFSPNPHFGQVKFDSTIISPSLMIRQPCRLKNLSQYYIFRILA